ncbi:MAG: hypothetical protein IJ043_05810 [Clostridia bacterium]|nr:hypothetical protein [Clostridia bacterium]
MKKGLIRAVAFAASLLLGANMCVFAAGAEEADPVVTRFVVASDVHTNEEIPSNQERLPKVFETAYAYAESRGGTIDAFVFNGDSVDGSFTDGVNLTQWELFLQGVQENIREESKFLLTLARTHDIYDSWGTKLRVTEDELNAMIADAFGTSGDHIAADWGYGSYLTKLNGVAVITLSNDMTNTNNAYNHCNNAREWLKEQLEALVAEDPEQPIFVVYHYPEVGALDYSQRWGSFAVSDILDDYPQVIAMNAHVHRDPRQARSIWQEDYTEVYDGAVSYTSYFDGNNQEVATYELSTYSIVEVTASGAVTIRYMDNLTGELLKEGNGSGETLVYSIPKAWDPSTWNYTYEARNTGGFPYFEGDAAVRLENGNTLIFDRAESEEAMLYYKVEISDGMRTETYYTGSRFFEEPLPGTLSVAVSLRSNTAYTAKITGVDSLYRETSNGLEYTFTTADSDLKQEGGIAAPAADDISFGTAEEFKAILASGENYAGKTLVQTADIDLNNEILTPGAAFMGTLDGNGFTIDGLFVAGTALFERAENAFFKNLNLSGTVIREGDAAALAGDAVNCTFENCMNGAVVIARGGKAVSFAVRAENTTFLNCIFDGSLHGAETAENQSSINNTETVTVEEKQLIFHTEKGDIKRSLKDGGRHMDWSFDTSIGSAEEFLSWLLGGGSEAALECDIDLDKLHGRLALIADLGLNFEVALNGNYCVIRGGKMALKGAYDLGTTDLTLTGENCWDADDFTAEELASGAAAYALGAWGQYEDTPAGKGKVVKITVGGRVNYVNAGTVYEVEVPYGYTAEQTSFTAEADTVITLTAHTADKTILGELYDRAALMNGQAFTEPAAFTAALNAAGVVLEDASAGQDTVDQAVTALTARLNALTLAEDAENYPAVSLREIYQQFFEVTKWSVNDLADLQAWSAWSKTHSGAGMEFHMTADIDMKNVNFGMIGSNEVPFKGKFDGHLHTVSHLLIDDTSGTGTGFFVYVADGDIRNFGIESGTVIGYITNRTSPTYGCSYEDFNGVAAVAGRADSTKFRHVWNRADVTHPYMLSVGNSCFAGLVARAQLGTSFVGCYNTGDVYGKHRASGITNWAQCTTNMARISNCFNIGRIYTEESAEDHDVNAIALYDDPQSSDNSYFSYNNYWLEGSAETGTSRDTVTDGYAAKGAEAPAALSAKEIGTDLAGLLNDRKYTGYYADTATWVQGDEGYPVIASVYDGDEGSPWPLADFEAHPDAKAFTISTPEELNKLATLSKGTNFAGYTFILLNDIDMSGTASFAMIGAGDPETATGKDTTKVFAGTFDGQGHTISGLNISSTSSWGGFFVALKNATVKNFTLSGVNMTGARYSGMLVGKICNSLIEDVHVVNSTFKSNSDYRTAGGLVGYIYNQSRGGGLTKMVRCSLEGSTLNTAANGGVGGLIGEMAEATITDCYVINNTINALNRSGLLLGYCYIGTIEGCFTYGNTLNVANNEYASGAAVGQFWYGGKSYFNDSIFCEKELNIYGCFQANNDPIFDNTYSLYASPSEGIAATEAQLSSGELAYLTGKAMKNGKLALANETDLAARKVIYTADGAEYAVRYTDSSGAVIGEVGEPAKPGSFFRGWKQTEEGYTAEFQRIPNDINADSKADTADAILLMQYLVGDPVELEEEIADVNGDGRITIYDAVCLLRVISA